MNEAIPTLEEAPPVDLPDNKPPKVEATDLWPRAPIVQITPDGIYLEEKSCFPNRMGSRSSRAKNRSNDTFTIRTFDEQYRFIKPYTVSNVAETTTVDGKLHSPSQNPIYHHPWCPLYQDKHDTVNWILGQDLGRFSTRKQKPKTIVHPTFSPITTLNLFYKE